MKQFIHKIIAIVLTFIVLMATMSFTIDMHYCGDKLVDYSFIQQAKSCKMKTMEIAPSCKNAIISKKSCCSNKKVIIEGQEDLKNSFDQLTFEQQTFIASLLHTYTNLFESLDTNITTPMSGKTFLSYIKHFLFDF